MSKIVPVSIYLAGPIDDIDELDANGWRQRVAGEFPNILFYLPNKAYLNAKNLTAELACNFNRHAIVQADALVANLDGPGRGLGTMREIEFARMHSKPVAAVGPYDLAQHLMAHDLICVSDVDEAVSKVLEKISTNRNQPRTMFGLPILTIEPDVEEDV